jgi:SAM-dependent methyltransferase
MPSAIQNSFPLTPPLTLPAGVSENELHSFLRSVRPVDAPEKEMENYCDQDWRRFVYTWGLVPQIGGKCLELGANPYFTTMLLKRFTGLELTLANYFRAEMPSQSVQEVTYRDWRTDQPATEPLNYRHFSVESEPFPFPDGVFDVVLFCEIIEHLQLDPAAVLKEINRVLKPGGTLILTTPNVSRLENVAKMIAGVNIYDPYSAYGAYGRHNREYNKNDLYLLLSYCGFDLEVMFTADVHHNHAAGFFPIEPLIPLLKSRAPDLGQYIFVRCQANRPSGAKKPAWLYRSYPAQELE